MDRPDAAAVREWAQTGDPDKPRVDFAVLGYPLPTSPDPDALERPVRLAVAYVETITGRKPLEALTDDDLVALAEEAVLMATLQRIVGGSSVTMIKSAGSLANGVKSFRAGDYSRVNRDLDELKKAGLINPWADLSDILLLLATPERREELLAELSGQPAPAMFALSPSDWCGYGYGVG